MTGCTSTDRAEVKPVRAGPGRAGHVFNCTVRERERERETESGRQGERDQTGQTESTQLEIKIFASVALFLSSGNFMSTDGCCYLVSALTAAATRACS